MLDPISFSIVAGIASLVAGGIKTLAGWRARKKDRTVMVQVGDKALQMSGSLTPEQIQAITEVFTKEVSKEKVASVEPNAERR